MVASVFTRRLSDLWQIGLLATCYVVAAKVSLTAAIPPGYATAVWPPSGIALAAVLLLGTRAWPGIWLGAAIANASVEGSLLAAALIASGNTAEALLGAWLVRRHVAHHRSFQHAEDVVKFIVLCTVGPAVAASVALVPLGMDHDLSWPQAFRNWWTWWQGDVTGIIVLAPLILSWSSRDSIAWPRPRQVERLCFALLLAASSAAVVGNGADESAAFTLSFMTLPFIIWAAFRFGQREVTTAIAVVCVIAVWYTVKGYREVDAAPLNERLLLLLTFISTVVTTGLILAAVLAERGRATAQLRKERDGLAALVGRRASDPNEADRALKQNAEYRSTIEALLREKEERDRPIRSADDQVTYLAEYDPLTGLPNRRTLVSRLNQELADAAVRGGGMLGCIFVNLDRFKAVNETYGHRAADRVLNMLSARLRRAARPTDLIARVGGDEFVVVCQPMTDRDEAGAIASSIINAMATPFRTEGQDIYVSASAGIAVHPSDGRDVEELLQNADAAMTWVKGQGRNNFQFYSPGMREQSAHRLESERLLRGALERKEFVLHYQPKVELVTGSVRGFEALLRWRHPDRGLVLPMQFIPILEDTGLIVPVGEWVLAAVCEQINRWKGLGVEPLPVSVNVSARQFERKQFDSSVVRVIRSAGVDPALVQLELTESLLMRDAEESRRTLVSLKTSGVRLSADDFGTGYSSLAYLKLFPLDELKIDRQFIRHVTSDPNDAAIAQAIISLGHTLKLRVVAEGVESESQVSFLRRHGCDEIQGNYFAAPMGAGACTESLRRRVRLQLPPG